MSIRKKKLRDAAGRKFLSDRILDFRDPYPEKTGDCKAIADIRSSTNLKHGEEEESPMEHRTPRYRKLASRRQPSSS